MGDSTREPLVRLAEDGSVLLPVDRAVFFGEHDTLDPENALVRVSPARALELLAGLRGIESELYDAKDRALLAEAQANVWLLLGARPQLREFTRLERDHDRDRYVMRLHFVGRYLPLLQEIAAEHGLPVVVPEDARPGQYADYRVELPGVTLTAAVLVSAGTPEAAARLSQDETDGPSS